jgi:hypothetical protein
MRTLQDIINQTNKDSFEILDKTIDVGGDVNNILASTKTNIKN